VEAAHSPDNNQRQTTGIGWAAGLDNGCQSLKDSLMCLKAVVSIFRKKEFTRSENAVVRNERLWIISLMAQ
jgi:hypothetical protein